MRYFYQVCFFLSLIACNNRQSTKVHTLDGSIIGTNDVEERNDEINDSLSQLVVPLSFKEFVLGDSYTNCMKAAEKSENFRKQWDNTNDRYEYVTTLLGVDVFVTIEEFKDTIYEIKLNSSKWSGYSLDTLYKSQYGITGYDDIPASKNKAGWGEQRDTKWVFKNGIVEINHFYNNGSFRGAYVIYTDKKHADKKIIDYLKPKYIKDSIAVANKEKLQVNRLKLYKVSDSSNYKELESYLQENKFERNMAYFRGYGENDTTAKFNGEYESLVTLDYSPKSKVVSRYSYRWEYSPTIIDEYSTDNPKYGQGYSDYYLIKSGGYFMNVLEIIRNEYGKPTSVMINKRPGYTTNRKFITDKVKIDTLDYTKLINSPSHFEVYWDNSERKIALTYFNGGYSSESNIEYEYINKYNLAIRQDEIDSINRKEQLTEIGTWVFFIILAIIVVFIIVKVARDNAKAKEEERIERRRKIEERYRLEQKEKEEKEIQKLHQLEELNSKHDNYVASLVDKYGNCDKTIRLYRDNADEIYDIMVFSQSKHLIIGNKELSFSDILDCIVNDDIKEIETVKTYRGNSTATSKTNTGNMIGRTIAGGVLLGGAGAIIGGSTAKRNTIIEHGTDTSIHNKEVEHNYTVAITVKDISNPVLYLNVGNDTVLKDEIISLMKVIISMH